MVKLRLTRIGKKKQPFYRIVAIDSRSRRQGQTLGLIGTYDPIHAQLNIREEDAVHWLKRGAQMSDTVEALLRSQGVLARFRGHEGAVKENVLATDKPARRRKLAQAAPATDTAEATEAPQTEADAAPETQDEA